MNVSIYYNWGKYLFSDYDALVERVKEEGSETIEPIKKVAITDNAEPKLISTFYYIRTQA